MHTLFIDKWCSLKDGVQSGNCQNLLSEGQTAIDESTVLKGKKLRNITPQTVTLLCCFEAMKNSSAYNPHAAIISATSMGAFDSVAQLLNDSYCKEFPHQISPGNIPNTVINSSAGIAAIHYQIDGPNISLCANELSFYEALTKAFILNKSRQAQDIFISALESWQGIYGQVLNFARIHDENDFPIVSYSALFLLSSNPKKTKVAQIIAVKTGRLIEDEQFITVVIHWVISLGLNVELLDSMNIWGEHVEKFEKYFLYTTFQQLSASSRVLMSGLGAWQLEYLLNTTKSGKYGVQIALDDEGFYGMAVIYKL